MDFRQIRYFLTLAETLNFTRAAETCHVTQPTLTQAIKRLEEELGGPLVLRDGRNTRLSELGKALKNHFQELADTCDTLRTEARALISGDHAELSIGVADCLSSRFLAKFLGEFRATYPHVDVHLTTIQNTDAQDALLTGEIDACLSVRSEREHPKLDFRTLYKEPLVVAFARGHEYEHEDEIELLNLKSQKVISYTGSGDEIDDLFDAPQSGNTAGPTASNSGRLCVNCSELAQSLLIGTGAIAIMPLHSITHAGVSHRPLSCGDYAREIALVTVYGGYKTPALRAFIAAAMEHSWSNDEDELDMPVIPLFNRAPQCIALT